MKQTNRAALTVLMSMMTPAMASAGCGCKQESVEDFPRNLAASASTLVASLDRVECTGPDLGLGGNNPCNGAVGLVSLVDTAGGFTAQGLRGPIVGWYHDISVEGETARLCAVPFSDTTDDCIASPVCADVGEVVYDGNPASVLRITVRAQFANGLAIDAFLNWPPSN